MNAISEDSALKFCELCNWVYESWVTHKIIFDKNKNPDANIRKVAYFAQRLPDITQKYSLLQICKLHDPAIQGKSPNLTIDYIVRFGDWGEEEPRVTKIVQELSEFYKKLKPARDKILAHNDYETHTLNTIQGVFPEGLDNKYFKTLQELVKAVSEKWLSNPIYPFNYLADAEEFLELLNRSPKF